MLPRGGHGGGWGELCSSQGGVLATRVLTYHSPRVSARLSGGSPIARSRMISAAVPPCPNRITGPKTGSSAMPARSSKACGRLLISSMAKPVRRAAGRLSSDLAKYLARRALDLRDGQIEAQAHGDDRFGARCRATVYLDGEPPSHFGGDRGGLGGVASSAGVDGWDGDAWTAACLRLGSVGRQPAT